MNIRNIEQSQDVLPGRVQSQEGYPTVIDFKNTITAALISVLMIADIPQTVAKPQNPRSRMMNQFHTDMFWKQPPFRFECPSWHDVLDNGFDEEAFDSLSSNGRPCFVNRTRYIEDIANFSGNEAFGKNYSVYSTFNPYTFEVDVPLTFYTGEIGGSDGEDYQKFIEHLKTCLQSDIPLRTQEDPDKDPEEEYIQRSLELHVPAFLSHDDSDKYDKYEENQYYQDNLLDTGVFWVNLHPKLKHNNIENWSVNISCASITKQLLNIVGLHTTYNTLSTYDALVPTDTNTSLRGLQRRFCKNTPGEDCQDILISKWKAQLQSNTPVFDCRDDGSTDDESIYGKPNIMNYEKLFDVQNFPVGTSICKSTVSVSTGTANTEISIGVKKDTQMCDFGDETVLTAILSSEEKLNNVKKHIEKIRKQGELYYITHHNRDETDIPDALTDEQFSAILYPNDLSNPEVKRFAETAKNAYRSKYDIKWSYGWCRK